MEPELKSPHPVLPGAVATRPEGTLPNCRSGAAPGTATQNTVGGRAAAAPNGGYGLSTFHQYEHTA
jgi:hypothetical protein